jgi:hypothetical protein
MTNARAISVWFIAAAILAFGQWASAQTETYKARLSTMPVENARLAVLAGSGTATASLAGRSLTVRGTFEGMKTPVTVAQIHLGPRGIRGPVMFGLVITKSPTDEGAGTIAGTFMLTPEQVEAVKSSRFYIQLNGEKAQDGGVWGWLIPQS